MHGFTPRYVIGRSTPVELSNFSINGLVMPNFESQLFEGYVPHLLEILVNAIVMRACSLKWHFDEKFAYPILFLVNYNYEMSKKGVLDFSISYLFQFSRYLGFRHYVNLIAYDVIVSHRLK